MIIGGIHFIIYNGLKIKKMKKCPGKVQVREIGLKMSLIVVN